MNITEFREKYPDYAEVDDESLSQALYKKHYEEQGVSYEEFKSKFIPTKQDTPPHPDSEYDASAEANRIVGGISQVQRGFLEGGGLAAGGLVGAGSAGPLGAAAGAGLGYAGGKKLADIVDESVLGTKQPAPLGEQMIGSAKDVAEGAAMEMSGQVLGKVVQKAVIEPIGKAVRNLAGKAKDIWVKARGYDIDLTPAELSDKKSLSLLESVLEKTPFSADKINKHRLTQLQKMVDKRQALLDSDGSPDDIALVGRQIQDSVDRYFKQFKGIREEAILKLKDRFVKKFGPELSYSDFGQGIKDQIAKNAASVRAKEIKLYKDVAESLPDGFRSETPNLFNKSKELQEKLGESDIVKKTGLQPILDKISKVQVEPSTLLSASGKTLPAKEIRPNYDWDSITQIRADLNQAIRDTNSAFRMGTDPNMKFQTKKAYKHLLELKNALDNDIALIGKQVGGEFQDSWEIANTFYKTSAPIFKDKKIIKILNSDPEKVANILFKPGNISEIRQAKKALGETNFKKITDRFTHKLIGEKYSPTQLMKNVGKYGDDYLSEIYSKEELSELKKLIAIGERSKEVPVDNAFFQKILKTDPGKVIDRIIQRNDPSGSRLIKHITSPSEQKNIKGKFLEKILGDKVTSLDKNLQNYGDDVLEQWFSKEELQGLKDMAQISQTLGKAERLAGNPSGTAQTVIAYSAGSAMLAIPTYMATGDWKKATGAGALVLAPHYLAKMYLSPTIRRTMILGMREPVGTKRSVELATKLYQAYQNMESEENTE